MNTEPRDNLTAPEINGADRNAFLFGFTPQAEIWNGRLAMIGFIAYLLWDQAGYSVLRDVLKLVSR
jgi:Chlorophyll A-B binding protein